MAAFKYFACFAGLALALVTAVSVRAAVPKKLAPPEICNMENRMTIFVDEDHILWACECEVLNKGFICRWQVIGGVDPITLKKRVKHHIRIYARPSVIA